jgi:hypothetical protein
MKPDLIKKFWKIQMQPGSKCGCWGPWGGAVNGGEVKNKFVTIQGTNLLKKLR